MSRKSAIAALCSLAGITGSALSQNALSANGAGKPRRLTSNKDEERAPAWSPDVKRIVFCCRRRGKPDFDICIMNADGTGEVKLTDTPGLNGFPNCGEIRTRR